jgi:hypothetical protein
LKLPPCHAPLAGTNNVWVFAVSLLAPTKASRTATSAAETPVGDLAASTAWASDGRLPTAAVAPMTMADWRNILRLERERAIGSSSEVVPVDSPVATEQD